MVSKKHDSFSDRKRAGWGMNLYRNRSNSWIAGVCSGLSDPVNMSSASAPSLIIQVGTPQ